MNSNKREFKNFLIDKKLQGRMTFYFTALSLSIVGLMMVIMNSHINQLRMLISDIANLSIPMQIAIEERFTQLISTALGFLLISIVLAIVYSIVISHRIAGPMYAILQYIEKLKAGNYDDERNLRPRDELAPIMDSLHDLSKNLKNKSK
ncbi:MAG: hypothetical protein A2Z20_07890 [Bdellovibrionales bacterium RBG_16_40_8]|nr:MAG: hypothetical protein A2Z20_07890 [Bdellovibrionales bacterium RBG_16_40_8]